MAIFLVIHQKGENKNAADYILTLFNGGDKMPGFVGQVKLIDENLGYDAVDMETAIDLFKTFVQSFEEPTEEHNIYIYKRDEIIR